MLTKHRPHTINLAWIAIFFAAYAQPAHARSVREFSSYCITLLNELTKEKPLSNIDTLVNPTRGLLTWSAGNIDTVNEKRDKIFGELQSSPNSAKTLSWFVLLRGFNSDNATTGPTFKSHSPKEDAPNREIVRTTNIEKLISHGSKKDTETEEKKILKAIDNIESRKLVETSDIDALDALRKRVAVFEGTTQFLQKKSAFEGQIDKINAQFLKSHRSALRQQIEHLNKGELLILNMPKITFDKDTHVPFLNVDVITFKDLDAFDAYYDRKMSVAQESSNIKRLMQQYLSDYLFARSMARRLQAIPLEDVVFSIDKDINHQEAENKIKYKRISDFIVSTLSLNSPIHPSPVTLGRHSRSLKWQQLRGKVYVYSLTAVLTSLALWDNFTKVKAIYSEVSDPVEEKQDKDHVFDEEYWKAKCSSKETYDEVEACLNRYMKILSAAIQDKHAAPENSVSKAELEENIIKQRELFDSVSVAVVYGTLERTPFSIYTQINSKRSISYAQDFVYKAGSKAKLNKKNSSTKEESNPTTIAYDQLPSDISKAKIQTLPEVTQLFEKLSKNFHNSSVRHALDRQSLADNLQAVTFLDLRHLIFLKETLDEMQHMRKSPAILTNDAKAKDLQSALNKEIAMLEDNMNSAMNSIEGTVKTVLEKIPVKDPSLPETLANDANTKN